MYTKRTCPGCNLTRFPEEETVKEGKKQYVIYRCRICHYQDIERLDTKSKSVIKYLWDPVWGKFEECAEVDTTEDTGD